jgi:hypothetical protein
MKLRLAKTNELPLQIVFFLLCIIPIAVAMLITTNGSVSTLHIFGFSEQINNVCLFKLITGYRCPVCGMTRCFAYMSHGNIAAAWHMSHAGVVLYFFCIYESAYRLLRIFVASCSIFKALRAIEIVFLIIVAFCVGFFFVAQFFDPALIA